MKKVKLMFRAFRRLYKYYEVMENAHRISNDFNPEKLSLTDEEQQGLSDLDGCYRILVDCDKKTLTTEINHLREVIGI